MSELLLGKKQPMTDRELVQAQADAPFCRNAVYRNKTIKDGAGRGWFTHGSEVRFKSSKIAKKPKK